MIRRNKKISAPIERHWLRKWFGVETESRGAVSLLWIFDAIGIIAPWIVIIILMSMYYSQGIIQGVNIWWILLFVWPALAIKMSWTQIQPEETGVVYFFGFPLFTVSAGPYLVFPGIFEIDVDSNANMTFLITGMTPEQLKKEYSEEEIQKMEILGMQEVTTSTPQMADWGMVKPDDWDQAARGLWKPDFTEAEKKLIEGDPSATDAQKKQPDPNHKQVGLNPSVMVILTKENYVLYRKNVRGKTPEERRKEVGRQLQMMAKSSINEEFKKRTYAMLIKLQTGKKLDEAVTFDVKDLLDGFGQQHEGSLGLNCLSAKVLALGAPLAVHTAVNEALAEVFNAQKKQLVGKGNKDQKFEEAEGTFQTLKREGEGKAEALKALWAEAESAGVSKARIAELQVELAAIQYSKHTYMTNRQSSGATGADAIKLSGLDEEALAKFAVILANEIENAKNKGGQS